MGTRTTTSAVVQSLTNFGEFVLGATSTAGAYRSYQTGNWNNVSTWERYNGTAWINPAPATPTDANSDVIHILNGHTVTVTANVTIDQTIIDVGGQVNINAGAIVLMVANGSGADLTVNGTLRSLSTSDITITGTIVVNSGGKYIHNRNGGNVPNATWNANSTCEISGMTNTIPGNIAQAFGNFTWNCTGQTANANLNGDPVTVNGNFTVITTGTAQLWMYDNNPLTTKNIGGSLVVQGGTLLPKTNTGNAIINVAGDFSVTGGTVQFTDNTGTLTMNVSRNLSVATGTLNLSGSAAVNTLNLSGNMSHTSGTITESSTGSATITFNGSTLQAFTGGGTISNTINFLVNNGAILSLGTSTVSGGGAFTLSAGATLFIGSPQGITSAGATGNVQVTGARTFNTGANYEYIGSAVQVTGNGLPATVNKLKIDNNSGVSLTSNVSVTDSLKLFAGVFGVGNNILTLTNVVYATAGTLASNTSGTTIYNKGSANQAVLAANYGNLTFSNFSKVLPVATIGVAGTFTPGTGTGHTITGSKFDFNGAAQAIPAFTYYKMRTSDSGVKTLGGAVTVSDSLELMAGSFSDGGYTLTAKGNIVNNIAHSGAGRILVTNTASMPILSGSGSYTNLEVDNVTYGVGISGDMTINGILTLTKGIINAGTDTVFMSASGNVSRPVTGGHINGFLSKYVPVNASPQSLTLEVGDASIYAPIDLTFIRVNTAGMIAGKTIAGEHPNLKQSGIDQNKDANRYWTMLNNGIVFTTYDGTFSFNSTDVDAAANPAFFFVRYYSLSLWYASTTNLRTATSTKAIGLSRMGQFVTGELSSIIYWTGLAGNSSWKNPQNWSSLSLPTLANQIMIDVPGTIDIDTVAYANKLTIMNDTMLITIKSGNYLKTADSVIVLNGRINIETNTIDSIAQVYFNGGTVGYTAPSGNQIVRGAEYRNLTIEGGGIKSAQGPITITDTLRIIGSATFKDSTSTITVNRHIINTGTHIGSGKILLNGTATQNLTGGGNYRNLELNNMNGAALSGVKTHVSSFTLTLGNVTISSITDTLAIDSTITRSVSGGSIIGNLQMYIPTGASSKIFYLGTASIGLPVRLEFANVATAGYVTVIRKNNQQHPNISDPSAIVDAAHDVRAYWTLVNNGVVLAGTYTLTLAFDSTSECIGGVSPTTTDFVGARWNGSSWSLVTTGLRSADSTRLDGINSFGDFVLGKSLAALIVAVKSGLWNDPTVWAGRVPGQNDTAQIVSPFTLILDANATVAKLVVSVGSTFKDSIFTLTVNGDVDLYGRWTGNGKISLATANGTISGSGAMIGTSILEIAGNNKTISSTANLALKIVSILPNNTLYNSGTVTLDSLIGSAANSTFSNQPGSTLIINGPVLETGSLDVGTCSNTVIYNGTTAQSIKPTTYCNITMNNSGSKTASTNFDTNGDLTINFGSNLTINSNVTIQVKGITTTAGTLNNGGHLLISE